MRDVVEKHRTLQESIITFDKELAGCFSCLYTLICACFSMLLFICLNATLIKLAREFSSPKLRLL